MGNCQAANGAALVIRHPNGRRERMYWSVTAGQVMQMNPGHYVTLIMPLPASLNVQNDSSDDQNAASFTRVKLLRPHEPLLLGRAYRLVTTQEVMKVIRAKKCGKMTNNQRELIGRSQMVMGQPGLRNRAEEQPGSNYQLTALGMQRENHTHKPRSIFAAARSKSWRPSLHSISEAGI